MIASKEHPKWEDLLTGKIKHHFHLIPASLMVSKCQRRISLDPSPQSVKKNIDELHCFFASHENAVSNDLKSQTTTREK